MAPMAVVVNPGLDRSVSGNKLHDLRARVKFQRDIRYCNLLCFTETWLNPAVLDHAIQPAEFFSVHRMDRTMELGKTRGGGVCLIGLRTITDYRTPSSKTVNADTSLADELNIFYARFKAAAHSTNCISSANSTIGSTHMENAGEENVFIILEHDVRKPFRSVNTRKAAGPDGITGRVLKACADQLASVFTKIFNRSLEQSMTPTCFKQSTIVPVPKKP
ncbi:hypothetical protein QTP86_018891 [Hemibagrus guttatus]|nr:hypothetical protein QTP86_018891 [Hemibagrus guttatus]